MGPTVLKNMKQRQWEQAIKECDAQEKRLQAFRSLERKVAAIKELNIASRELNVSQLKVMAMWYKRANDSPVPTTRSLLLARLLETCNRGDQVAPPLPNARPEPLPEHVVLVNTGADVVEQAEHQ